MDHAGREILESGGQERKVGREVGAEIVEGSLGDEEVIVKDIDEDASDTAAGRIDAGDTAADGGVGVSKAINFTVEGNALTEGEWFDGLEPALEEIAQEVAERDQAGIGKHEQMPEIIHFLSI